MRSNWFLAATLMCAALFFACTDDNGNEEEDEGALLPDVEVPNDDGDVTARRLVTKITENDEDHYMAPIERVFEYNEGGQLVKITMRDYNEDETVTTNLSYLKDRIEMSSSNGDKRVFYLEDGRVVSSDKVVDRLSYLEYEYSYSGGYLRKIVDMEYNDSVRLEVEDGELRGIRYDDGEFAVTPSSVDNNTSIDLLGYVDFCEMGLFCGDDSFFIGLCGKRFEHLPSEIEEETSGFYALSETFDYELDDEGYVTEITLTEREGDSRNVYTFTIEYEDDGETAGIEGEWVCQEADETGDVDEIKYELVLEGDGTGSLETIAIDGGKETAAVRLYFEYSLSEDADGDFWITMIDSEGVSRYRYELSVNRLTLYDDGDVLRFERQ